MPKDEFDTSEFISVEEVKSLYGTPEDVCTCGAGLGPDGVYLCAEVR